MPEAAAAARSTRSSLRQRPGGDRECCLALEVRGGEMVRGREVGDYRVFKGGEMTYFFISLKMVVFIYSFKILIYFGQGVKSRW
jgi:hypothetical protein